MHELSRTDARRVAVRAQLLTRGRPTDLHDVVRGLTLLRIDPTAAIAPNADVVAWSCPGSRYAPADLEKALVERSLLELRATIRPSEDLALFPARMAEWPGRGEPGVFGLARPAPRAPGGPRPALTHGVRSRQPRCPE